MNTRNKKKNLNKSQNIDNSLTILKNSSNNNNNEENLLKKWNNNIENENIILKNKEKLENIYITKNLPILDNSVQGGLTYYILSFIWFIITFIYLIAYGVIIYDINILTRNSKKQYRMIFLIITIFSICGYIFQQKEPLTISTTYSNSDKISNLQEIPIDINLFEKIKGDIQKIKEGLENKIEIIAQSLEENKNNKNIDEKIKTIISSVNELIENEIIKLKNDDINQLKKEINSKINSIKNDILNTQNQNNELLLEKFKISESTNEKINSEIIEMIKFQLNQSNENIKEELFKKLQISIKSLEKEIEILSKNQKEIEIPSNEQIKNWILEMLKSSQQLSNEQIENMKFFIETKIKETLHSQESQKNIISTEDDQMINLIKKYIQNDSGIGKPDYALQSAGATILLKHTTLNMEPPSSFLSYINKFLGFQKKASIFSSPFSILQPDNSPGNCWCFYGSRGNITIQLAHPSIFPTSFTLEHISKHIAYNIQSAPKNFAVYGLTHEHNGQLLGNYTYSINDENNIQHFKVQAILKPNQTFPLIKLQILSNQGHPDHTCVYRFRVHGDIVKVK